MNNNKIYLQITSGRGSIECCRVVVLVLERILDQAKMLGLLAEVIELEEGDMNNTLYSAIISLEGIKIENIVDEWEGSIQWIAQSPYRIYHKRKNWFVGVKSFTPNELSDIDTKYITYQTLRSSGAGGNRIFAINQLFIYLSRNKVEIIDFVPVLIKYNFYLLYFSINLASIFLLTFKLTILQYKCK